MADAQLHNVYKRFGNTPVLEEINLSLHDGEFVTFVGPSGSGKSTLLRILSGLDTVTSGKIHIGGKDVTETPPKNRNISMVFQNYALYPHMTVAKNITFGMRMRHEKKSAQTEALKRVASMLKLERLLDRKPRQLSGGQRQRVAMARAIVHSPDLFLMDEPLSNLDAKLRNEVRLAIMELQEKLGCTMVYVTHDQIEAMTMADRIVVLDSGKVQQIGSPQELYHRPENIFTAGFIGNPAMNFLPVHSDGSFFRFQLGAKNRLPGKITSLAAGHQEFILGIRPEHIFSSPDACWEATGRGDSEELFQLERTILSSEMLGSSFLLHTEKEAGGIAFFQPNNGIIPNRGETVSLYFSSSCIHLFDKNTGARIN